jgi:ribonuclease P protein component
MNQGACNLDKRGWFRLRIIFSNGRKRHGSVGFFSECFSAPGRALELIRPILRNLYVKKNVSAEQHQKKTHPRFPGTYGHQGRPRGNQAAPCKGQKTPFGLRPDGLPESSHEESLRGEYSFRPHERIRSSADFQRVKTAGKRAKTLHFGLNVIPNDLEFHRLGLIVQKRFWSAPKRNRIKRILREWFRLNKNRIPQPPRDIVIIARPGAETLSPGDLSQEFLPVLNKQDGST